jgi:hypothetical protein
MQVGAACAPFVRLLMLATAPIAVPISKILDRSLGSKPTVLFRRQELTALVEIETEQVRLLVGVSQRRILSKSSEGSSEFGIS